MRLQSRRSIFFRIGALALLASLGGRPLSADGGSWFSRSVKPPKQAPAPAAAPASPAKHAPSATQGTSVIEKTIPSTVPATGDDAAYTAFDQGRYLTALKLAEEAAQRGEPQASTLIGRITPKASAFRKTIRKPTSGTRRRRSSVMCKAPSRLNSCWPRAAASPRIARPPPTCSRRPRSRPRRSKLQSGSAVPQRRRQTQKPDPRFPAYSLRRRERHSSAPSISQRSINSAPALMRMRSKRRAGCREPPNRASPSRSTIMPSGCCRDTVSESRDKDHDADESGGRERHFRRPKPHGVHLPRGHRDGQRSGRSYRMAPDCQRTALRTQRSTKWSPKCRRPSAKRQRPKLLLGPTASRSTLPSTTLG